MQGTGKKLLGVRRKSAAAQGAWLVWQRLLHWHAGSCRDQTEAQW